MAIPSSIPRPIFIPPPGGTQGSQEAAQGKLAALDIDLEDKGGKKHVVYHTVTKTKQGILGS